MEETIYQKANRIISMNETDWNISHQKELIRCYDEMLQIRATIKHNTLQYDQELKEYVATKTLELKELSEKKLTEKQIDAIIQNDEKRKEIQTKLSCEKYSLEQMSGKCDVLPMYITCVRDAVK